MSADDVPGDVPVTELTYTNASRELDGIVEFFERQEVDVDQLVARLERAGAIVDELDRRIRKTHAQVEELVPKLEAVARGSATEDDDDDDEFDDEAVGDDDLEEAIEIYDDGEDEDGAPAVPVRQARPGDQSMF